MPDVNFNNAHVLGFAGVTIEIAPGISINLSEPDPNKIDPRQAASMQIVVMLLRAMNVNHNCIQTLDRFLQSIAHVTDYLARRVDLLESRALVMLPEDERREEIEVHRASVRELVEGLRRLHADSQAKGEAPS